MRLFKNADKRLVASGLLVSAGAVLLYCVANNISAVADWFKNLLSYFSSVTWGLVLAYVMRPLSELFERILPKGIKKEQTRIRIGSIGALIVLIVLILIAIYTVLPSLTSSIMSLVNNIDSYVSGAKQAISRLLSRFDELNIDVDKIIGSSDELIRTAGKWLGDNVSTFANAAYSFSNRIINFIIIIAMAVYALFDRVNLKKGLKRVNRALFGDEKAAKLHTVLRRGDVLTKKFLSSNLLDAVIIGVVNYIFLGITKCPYQLVLALMLGITNYVPTFGPIAGGAIGGLVVLLTKPELLLGFIIFTVVLQQIDGNVIKPLLFGDSTGLSPFWVLVAIVVGGKMFGVIGMILGVPVVALLGSLLNESLNKNAPEDNGEAPRHTEPILPRLLSKLFRGRDGEAEDGSETEESAFPAPETDKSAAKKSPKGKKASKKASKRR